MSFHELSYQKQFFSDYNILNVKRNNNLFIIFNVLVRLCNRKKTYLQLTLITTNFNSNLYQKCDYCPQNTIISSIHLFPQGGYYD